MTSDMPVSTASSFWHSQASPFPVGVPSCSQHTSAFLSGSSFSVPWAASTSSSGSPWSRPRAQGSLPSPSLLSFSRDPVSPITVSSTCKPCPPRPKLQTSASHVELHNEYLHGVANGHLKRCVSGAEFSTSPHRHHWFRR